MIWQSAPQAIALLGAALIDASMFWLMWRRRAVPGGQKFLWLLLAMFCWSLSSALEWSVADLAWKVIWRNIAYLSITAIPAVSLLFCLEYTGQGIPYRRLYRWLLLEPLVVQVMVWTNPYHHLHYTTLEMLRYQDLSVIVARYGAAFWVHAAYSYVVSVQSPTES